MTTTELKPGREEFRKLARYGNLIPVYTELVADAETPVSAFSKIDDGGYSFLLESAEHIDQGGRYSFVGSNPRVVFKSHGRKVTVIDRGEVREFETAGDPLAELQKLMAQYIPVPVAHLPRFSGGAVGYLGYDMVRFFEPTIGQPPLDDLQLPEAVFMIAETLIIFDHPMRRMRVLANALVENEDADAAYDAAVQAIQRVLLSLDRPARLPVINVHRQPVAVQPTSNTTEEEFRKMVEEAHEYIHAGDIFQVVLSQRFETAYDGDPLTLYRCLRFVNPSPYLFCLKFGGEFSLVGSSPEVHVRAINGKVEIRPIAGTRRRGNTPEQDAANATELLADPKERAEHLMLVDLARNDVGRIADFGTVRVTDFMTIERYSHVMHIVSNVVGQLHAEKNAYDVMRATFPAGTVSGSPKVRAMQIINQLEKTKRGTYAGAVGYFGFDGNSDSCIALRTIALKDGKAYVQAGAGIVADSTPEGEYQETANKAMGMIRAIERARESAR
ncbi:MAG TPA: anthranilate synthase component I [Chthoniobacteraceae bacterium]|jgi:anthranilate synthase component 1|nr:anthranilate synthase component I [Chthoniobacteraceae bacterium]